MKILINFYQCNLVLNNNEKKRNLVTKVKKINYLQSKIVKSTYIFEKNNKINFS